MNKTGDSVTSKAGESQSPTNQSRKESSFAVNHFGMGGSAMNVMSMQKS